MKKTFLTTVITTVLLCCSLLFTACNTGTASNEQTDQEIIENYLANKSSEYSDEDKVKIVTAYKNLLETNGEDYVDALLTRDEQNELTFMGMSVNVYVFRDYKNYGYLNSDNSFIDVKDFSSIAGFDVDAPTGADGYADIAHVDITIDNKTYATADLTEEINSFLDRYEEAKKTSDSNTIYGVDVVDVDSDTRLYITYLDVQYDDSRNITSLRVSGHLALR